MKKESDRREYRKPGIVSEKVFEQAALACSRTAFGVPGVTPTARPDVLKNNANSCGYNAS